MKVILQKFVLNLGVCGQVVNVRPGYAFNFLIPNKLACIATKESLESFQQKQSVLDVEHKKHEAEARKISDAISEKPIYIVKPINDTGSLYGAISQQEIADAITAEFAYLNFKFDRSQIVIHDKIKIYGVFSVQVNPYYGVSTNIFVVVSKSKLDAENLFKKYNEKE